MKRSLLIAFAALALLALPPTSVGAGEPGSPTRLNGDLEAAGPDRQVAITADGSTAVYIAPEDTPGVRELYAVDIEGGASRKLNGAIASGTSVTDFKLSPDGNWVVYRARRTVTGGNEIYAVSIDGGSVRSLSGNLADNRAIADTYTITSDSERVVFVGDIDTNNRFEIYSAELDSGDRVKLNDALGAEDDVLERWVVAPDSSKVVFRTFDDSEGLFQIYSANVDGSGGDTVVNDTLVDGGGVDGDDFVITPDSQHVVYMADQDTDDLFELYRAPITGGSSIKLSGTVTSPGVVEGSTYVSPDGEYVVFRLSTSGALQLYSARTDGTGSRVRLNGSLTSGGQVDGSILISPNSQRVAYMADQETDQVFELFSVPIGGGTSVKLSGSNPSVNVADNDAVPETRIAITPDSSRIVFKAATLGGAQGLYSASMTGGGFVRLSDELTGGGIFDDFAITSDSSQVLYIGAQRDAASASDLLFELWRVPASGGTPERQNGTLAGGDGDVQSFVLSPTSGHVVYVADGDTDNVNEIYQVTLGLTCNGRLATIVGTDNAEVINGTSGPDVIVALGGADTINGFGGRDVICGNGGADIINGGSGQDEIFGGRGADTISGGKKNDLIEGGAGGDTIDGDGGRDEISGGSGHDTINGGGKGDTINGNGGRDTINGNKGGDTLNGGGKADIINGNGGNDTINGGGGSDTCSGGGGSDTLASCP